MALFLRSRNLSSPSFFHRFILIEGMLGRDDKRGWIKDARIKSPDFGTGITRQVTEKVHWIVSRL